MQDVIKYTFLLLSLASAQLFAQNQQDCLSINDNFASLTDSGKYRFVNEISTKTLAKVNFDKLKNYQQYLNEATQVITNKNPRASMPCPIVTETYAQLAQENNWEKIPKVSQLVAPYELAQNNNTKAILLIHGLTDSPFTFHDLSQFFYQQGFTVRTLLLPGHGTAPSDLLDVSYQEWQIATQFAIEATLAEFEQVYLGGFSTGGALIFDYLMQQQQVGEKINGLFMWSPASKAKSDMAWLAKYVDYLPFVDWIDLDADIDFVKYESFPYNAAAQVHDLMSGIVGENSMKSRIMHDIPIFVVASEHDQTIETKQTLVLIEQWQQHEDSVASKRAQSRLLYYGNKTSLSDATLSNIKVTIPDCQKGEMCAEFYDIAHSATTNAPSNPHYGISGQYRNCGHYATEPDRYKQCKEIDKPIIGETTAENLSHSLPLQRLTFNPHYQHMIDEITRFLKVTNY